MAILAAQEILKEAHHNAEAMCVITLEISLEEAFRGISEKLNLLFHHLCDSCHGSGSEDNSKPTQCNTCKGSGKVRVQQGFFIVERTCTTCSGTGQIIKTLARNVMVLAGLIARKIYQ